MFRDLAQIGVVVKDLDRAMAGLSKILGIGPFSVLEDDTDPQKVHRGKPGNFAARKAFVKLGPIELELIQPLHGECIWGNFLRERGEGIHHIRFNVPDVEPVIEHMEGQGIEVSQMGSGLRPGTRWVNFDTDDRVGFTVEIMNALPGSDGRTPRIVDGKVQV
jgi:methylmalonyl-CoA/ethylmalonyl-CoA epimerase